MHLAPPIRRAPLATTPFQRLPVRARRIIEQCRMGETLCLRLQTCRVGRKSENQEWFFEPSGRPVKAISARQAVETPFLTAAGDGLFPDFNQTWRAS